jgi:hypothetical protein
VLDAFVPALPRPEAAVEAAIDASDTKAGLVHLPAADEDTGSAIRLEDVIDQRTIASEVVASRTLAIGQAYEVEPRDFHVVLEDFRGTRIHDNVDMAFAAGQTYVGVRLGRAGDAEYPEKLLMHLVGAASDD